MKKVNLALVGATGMVGRTFLKVLDERDFPINNLYLFSSSKSAGSTIEFRGKEYTVIELTEKSFEEYDIDMALFSAGGGTSERFAPMAAKNGVIVVDNSSFWRMDPEVPLVVPEVNPDALNEIKKGIVANPNCSTIQAMLPLKALHDKIGIKRVVFSTYQAVSGSGVKGVEDLEKGLEGNPTGFYPHGIAFNCLPHIDSFLDDGYTKEEMKMVNETHKILDENIRVTATTVRVPVKNGHSESVNVEFVRPFELEEVYEALNNMDGVVVMDDPKNNVYPTARDCSDKDEVFVGRIRRDFSVDNGINLWIVADNIRKGAATNTVQIGYKILEMGLI